MPLLSWFLMSQKTTHTLIRNDVTPRPQEAKMRKAALFLFIVVFVLFMAGCGSQSQPPSVTDPLEAMAPASLTITDTPPTGVTVLFFQLNITGASLSSQLGGSTSLLSGTNPIPVNVSQLQTA